MKSTEVTYYLERTTRKFLVLKILALSLWSLCIVVTCLAIGHVLSYPFTPLLVVSTAAAAVFFAYRSISTNLFGTSPEQLVGYINRQFPELQESSDLLLADDQQLSSLQKLQKEKSSKALQLLYPRIRLPVRLATPVASLAAAMTLAGLLFYAGRATREDAPSGPSQTIETTKVSSRPAGISKIVVRTIPPAYTGKEVKERQDLQLNVLEGTFVEWQLTFSDKIRDAQLLFNGRDTLTMTRKEPQQFNARRRLITNGFYQVIWTNSDGNQTFSDYFPITVSPDLPPIIKVNELEQFIELSMEDNLVVDVRSTITDDYAILDAYIIATVSKGSGESVKFREEKLRFSHPINIAGRSISAQRQMDMLKLGLEPGDELYFYIEALDSRAPRQNKSRTETYFISLRDTAELATSVDASLGVDVMPEYFRSQRQIIIDSEKLLKERKSISNEKFNGRSNNLGHDQKVLRLRYGEFLGEEFESSIGPAAGSQEHGDEEDVAKVYGHQHDTEKEHEPEMASHDRVKKDSETDPAKAYMHAHDSEEEATFFTQSIRAKLKAAVTIMWDAELHLRLNDPAKSLPFQYRALKLLKEISQDSRIYVHRTGFDPPPLKEDKRLSGDLSELRNNTETNFSGSRESYPGIRAALLDLNNFDGVSSTLLHPDLKARLINAGNELSLVAIDKPGRYLKTLSLLRALAQNEVPPDDTPAAIRDVIRALYSVLPKQASSPAASNELIHAMNEKFLDKVKVISSEKEK